MTVVKKAAELLRVYVEDEKKALEARLELSEQEHYIYSSKVRYLDGINELLATELQDNNSTQNVSAQ